LTASFWLTRLSSARRISKVTSLGAETGLTVLDSSADINADAKSWAVTGDVTCELMLLSKHHLTAEKKKLGNESKANIREWTHGLILACKAQGERRGCTASVQTRGCIQSETGRSVWKDAA
jgi:hypothetical protein